MTASGTYQFSLSNSDVLLEAFDRIGVRPTEIDQHHINSAKRSVNLELQTWANRGVNLWRVNSGTISLIAGQATYTLDPSVESILDVYYTTPATGVTGTLDRMLLPIGRTDYAMLPNKGLAGAPSTYWFQRLETPLLTIYPADSTGSPHTVVYNYLRQIADINAIAGETPDVPNRFLEALTAALASRLARKFAPPLAEGLKAEAGQAWAEAAAEDREVAPLYIKPDFSVWYDF